MTRDRVGEPHPAADLSRRRQDLGDGLTAPTLEDDALAPEVAEDRVFLSADAVDITRSALITRIRRAKGIELLKARLRFAQLRALRLILGFKITVTAFKAFVLFANQHKALLEHLRTAVFVDQALDQVKHALLRRRAELCGQPVSDRSSATPFRPSIGAYHRAVAHAQHPAGPLCCAHTRNLLMASVERAAIELSNSGGDVIDRRHTRNTEQRLVQLPDGRRLKLTTEVIR